MGLLLIGLIGIIGGIWVLTLDFSMKLGVGILLILVGAALIVMKLLQSYVEGKNTRTR